MSDFPAHASRRTTWLLRTGVGIHQPLLSAGLSVPALSTVAVREVARVLTFGRPTVLWALDSTPWRTSSRTATGVSSPSASWDTTTFSATSGITVSVQCMEIVLPLLLFTRSAY